MIKKILFPLFVVDFLLSSFAFSEGLASSSSRSRPVSSGADVEYRQALEILRNPKTGDIPLYAVDHYAEAAQLLQSAADRGHRWAMIRLGSLYLCGQGVDQSTSRAFNCYLRAGRLFLTETVFAPVALIALVLVVILSAFKFRSAFSVGKSKMLALRADSGCAVLQYKLGMRYFHGKGTSRRVTDARRLFEKSAEQNYAPAQIEMGRFFKEGIIVQANRLKAAEWFQKAASQGHAEGLFLVGGCYERGEGLPLNFPKAQGCYLMAAAVGHNDAQLSAELCARRMTDRQKQDAREFAKAYAVENGFNVG